MPTRRVRRRCSARSSTLDIRQPQREAPPQRIRTHGGTCWPFHEHLNLLPAGPTNEAGTGRRIMHPRRYWLDYDPVALAVLVIGIGLIELLALSI